MRLEWLYLAFQRPTGVEWSGEAVKEKEKKEEETREKMGVSVKKSKKEDRKKN